MNNEKLYSLIIKLNIKTEAKQAIWQKSSGAEEFKILLKTGTIAIQKYRISNFQPPSISITIYNSEGDLIEDYVIEEVAEGYNEADELFTNIKRAYYKVEETVDDILSQLDSDEILGEEEDELPF